jgi:hypothetical protein
MAPKLPHDDDIFMSTINEQPETEISLEPVVDYKAWKPDRKVKMALAVQTFCVVRLAHPSLVQEPANTVEQFIISIDMTILTATLPVSVDFESDRDLVTD